MRFDPDFPECAHCLMKSRRGFARSSGRRILDEVIGRLGITDIEPLFGGNHDSLEPYRSGRRRADDPALRGLQQTYIVHLPSGTNLTDAANQLRRDPLVVGAEPNYIASIEALGGTAPAPRGFRARTGALAAAPPPFNDPLLYSTGSWGQPFPDLWRLNNIRARQAWRLAQGEGVAVAVVDSGLDTEHEDIAASVWHNPGEIDGNGLDDDGNGFVDDVIGWDFTTCDRFDYQCFEPKEPGAALTDRNGHGTFVAGIIAATADNGVGIVGVAPRATLMAIKAINREGQGTVSELADAIVYAADNGARVINASWAVASSETLRLAVEYAVGGRGATMVAAAGNQGAPMQRGVFPANYPRVLAVGSTTNERQIPSYSNFDGALDLVAPGGGDQGAEGAILPERSIVSLAATDSDLQVPCRLVPICDERGCRVERICAPSEALVGEHYVRASGTSFAAPAVAGVAALVLGRHPEASPEQVRQVLVESAADLNDPGWDKRSGYGQVDALAALEHGLPAVALITNIENSQKIWRQQFPYEVRGTVRAPAGETIREWRLSIAWEGSQRWRSLARGGGELEDGVIGRLRLGPRQRLRPGKRYTVRLEIETGSGGRASDTRTLLIPDPKYAVVPIPNPKTEGGYGVISGDGRWIAIEHYNRDIGRESTVWLFDHSRHKLQKLGFGYQPFLSRDGGTLLYGGLLELPDGQYRHGELIVNVFTGAVDTFPEQWMGGGPMDQYGRRVFLNSTFDLVPGRNTDQSAELYVYDRASGDVRQITDSAPCREPTEIRSFAVDSFGQRAVVESPADLAPGGDGLCQREISAVPSQIFVVDTQKRDVRQITRRPLDGRYHNGNVWPAISGDGGTISWFGDGGTMVLDLDSGLPEVVTTGGAGSPQTILSFDGNLIAYASTNDEDPTVGNEDRSYELFVKDRKTGRIAQATDTLAGFAGVGRADASDGLTRIVVFPASVINPTHLALPLVQAQRTMSYCPPPKLFVPTRITAREGERVTVRLTASDACSEHVTFVAQRNPPIRLL